MRVEATKPGFYLCLREAGQRFDIPKELFSKNWMKKAVGRPPKEEGADAAPETEDEAGEAAAESDAEDTKGQ